MSHWPRGVTPGAHSCFEGLQVFQNAVASLGEDAELRAVQNVKRYLLKGIGVHHGGLIPLVKELVEILFQESLIKVLFATETFAMGLNMPARAVLFTAYTKKDSVCVRALTSGEYIQMSGRAGRRGKDDRGYAIMLVEDASSFSPEVARAMLRGAPMPLVSRFKLSYYTLLNLTKRTEGGLDHMEYLIAHSFQSFQHEKAIPGWKKRLKALDDKLKQHEGTGMTLSGTVFYACWMASRPSSTASVTGVTQEMCEEFVDLRDQIGRQEQAIHKYISKPGVCVPYLSTGRLVRVQEGSVDWGWGVVLQAMYKPPQDTVQQTLSALPSCSETQCVLS
jgi:ATP-dependent RNA helicase DOB1